MNICIYHYINSFYIFLQLHFQLNNCGSQWIRVLNIFITYSGRSIQPLRHRSQKKWVLSRRKDKPIQLSLYFKQFSFKYNFKFPAIFNKTANFPTLDSINILLIQLTFKQTSPCLVSGHGAKFSPPNILKLPYSNQIIVTKFPVSQFEAQELPATMHTLLTRKQRSPQKERPLCFCQNKRHQYFLPTNHYLKWPWARGPLIT